MKKIIALCSFLVLAITTPVFAANSQAPVNLPGMLQNVMPGVVNIAAQGEIPQMENPFEPPERGNNGQAPLTRRFEALGSGVIVDAQNGYILTNAHILRDAKSITVTLGDGRIFKAKLIGTDLPSDIAVLQIKPDKLTVIAMGDSDVLKVGNAVAAIGNPFGLNQTVTSGIVSALQRTRLGIETYENFIQTDASINPGNSGGALVNMQGQLIGINTAIFTPAGGNIGIGFAIPINMARSVMTQLIKYGSVSRGLMGVILQDLTPALADAFQQSGKVGGLVSQVSLNSPAADAGIKAGDLIQEVNGKKIENAAQVRNMVGLLRVGSRVTLKILRNGKTLDFSLVTADPKQYLAQTEQKNRFLFSMALRNFNQETPLQGHVVGVQVVRIAESSVAWRAGLRPGDVIVSANQIPISNMADLQRIAAQSKDVLLLNIMRGDGSAFIVVK